MNENTGNRARLVNVPIWTLINILLIQLYSKEWKHFSSYSGQFLLLLLSNQPCLQKKKKHTNSSSIIHSAVWIVVPWLCKYVVCVHINSVLTLKAWILNTAQSFLWHLPFTNEPQNGSFQNWAEEEAMLISPLN